MNRISDTILKQGDHFHITESHISITCGWKNGWND